MNGRQRDTSLNMPHDTDHENGSNHRNGHEPPVNGNGVPPSRLEPDDAVATRTVNARQLSAELAKHAPSGAERKMRTWVPPKPPLEEGESSESLAPQMARVEKVKATAGDILGGLGSPDFLSRFELGDTPAQPEDYTPA